MCVLTQCEGHCHGFKGKPGLQCETVFKKTKLPAHCAQSPGFSPNHSTLKVGARESGLMAMVSSKLARTT